MGIVRKIAKYGTIVCAASVAIAYPWDTVKFAYWIAGEAVALASSAVDGARDVYDRIAWKGGIEKIEHRQDKLTRDYLLTKSAVAVRCEPGAPEPAGKPYSGIYNWAFENKIFRAEGTPYPYTIAFDKDLCNVSEVTIDCTYAGREGTPLPTHTPWREGSGPWGGFKFWGKPHRYKFTEVEPPQPLGSICVSMTYTLSNGRTLKFGGG